MLVGSSNGLDPTSPPSHLEETSSSKRWNYAYVVRQAYNELYGNLLWTVAFLTEKPEQVLNNIKSFVFSPRLQFPFLTFLRKQDKQLSISSITRFEKQNKRT